MTCTIISNRAELQLECKNENEMPYCGIKLEHSILRFHMKNSQRTG